MISGKQKKKNSYLSHDIQITEGCHVRMGPCVNGDIAPSFIGLGKLFGPAEDVDSDHVMSGSLVIFVQKIKES